MLCSLLQDSRYKNEEQSGFWYMSIPKQLLFTITNQST